MERKMISLILKILKCSDVLTKATKGREQCCNFVFCSYFTSFLIYIFDLFELSLDLLLSVIFK